MCTQYDNNCETHIQHSYTPPVIVVYDDNNDGTINTVGPPSSPRPPRPLDLCAGRVVDPAPGRVAYIYNLIIYLGKCYRLPVVCVCVCVRVRSSHYRWFKVNQFWIFILYINVQHHAAGPYNVVGCETVLMRYRRHRSSGSSTRSLDRIGHSYYIGTLYSHVPII